MARSATTWAPGTSGNANGRPSVLRRARGLLRASGPDAALAFLAGTLEDGATAYRQAVAASEILRLASGAPLRRRRHWHPAPLEHGAVLD